jgi:hypothetical protein
MWAVLHGGMIYGIKSTYDRSTRVEGKIVTEYWSTPVLYSVGSFVYTLEHHHVHPSSSKQNSNCGEHFQKRAGPMIMSWAFTVAG